MYAEPVCWLSTDEPWSNFEAVLEGVGYQLVMLFR